MKSHARILTIFTLFLAAAGAAEDSAEPAAAALQWRRDAVSLSLVAGDHCLWRYRHDATKPYFHPLATADGFVLTDERPRDHVWHLGNWFSWKLVNGVNYWEERNGRADGMTEVTDTQVETKADFEAIIVQTLRYRPPGQATVLSERRTITVSPPDADGVYLIDWDHRFVAEQDATLDRTPIAGEPGGRPHGGYAGSSLRLNKGAARWRFLNADGTTEAAQIHGKPSAWLQLAGAEGAVAILDHPQNLGYPSRWYVYAKMPFFSPAVLFAEKHVLQKGETLRLRYRTVVASRPLSADTLGDLQRRFSETAPPPN